MVPVCPRFEKASALLSKRWVGLIIHILMQGPQRFNSLAETLSISPRVLSERLKLLEDEKIITRRIFDETPVRIAYQLTEKGYAMGPLLEAMATWAEAWA